jgi:hypothetical protein
MNDDNYNPNVTGFLALIAVVGGVIIALYVLASYFGG